MPVSTSPINRVQLLNTYTMHIVIPLLSCKLDLLGALDRRSGLSQNSENIHRLQYPNNFRRVLNTSSEIRM